MYLEQTGLLKKYHKYHVFPITCTLSLQMPIIQMLYKPDLMTCQHEYGTHNHIWCILPIHRLECRHPSLGLFPLKNNQVFSGLL